MSRVRIRLSLVTVACCASTVAIALIYVSVFGRYHPGASRTRFEVAFLVGVAVATALGSLVPSLGFRAACLAGACTGLLLDGLVSIFSLGAPELLDAYLPFLLFRTTIAPRMDCRVRAGAVLGAAAAAAVLAAGLASTKL